MAKGRPPTPLNTIGKINTKQLESGQWQSEAIARTGSGKRRKVRARGKSKSAAERQLKAKCTELTGLGDAVELTPISTVSELMDAWLKQHDVSDRSKTIYRNVINRHIAPALGDVRINEVSTPLLQRFLSETPEATARTARAVLSGAFSLTVRWSLSSRNPVPDTRLPKKRRQEVRALSNEEIARYRSRLVEWCGGNGMGPARGEGLVEIVDVLIGTGCRIGEVLALRWQDVDIGRGVITVAGTVDDDTGKRKDMPKTVSSRRKVTITSGARAALQRQWEKPYREFMGEPVFPTRTGSYRTVRNVESRLRSARNDEDTITPHHFRKTVATRIERAYGVMAASRHLGHSSTAVTEAAYLARPEELPDFTSAIEDLAVPERP